MVWDTPRTKDLHLMHLNINSLVYKVDELRYIAKLSNPAVVTDLDILMENHDLLCCDKNGNMGGGGCYIRNDLSYTQNFLMTLKMFSSKFLCQKSNL